MNLQDAASLTIPEGGVRNIRDGNGNLLWSSVGYNVRYNGDTTQQTYHGYQLLPIPYASGDSRTHRGITYTVNPDGTIVMNGKNDGTASSAYFFVDRYGSMPMFELEAGTYYFIPNSSDVRYEMYDGTNYYTFTPSNNYTVTFANNVSIRQAYAMVLKTNTTTFTNYKLYPMLTKLQSPTTADYEPYTGSTSAQASPAPNPDYPQPIQVVTGGQTVTISDGVDSENYTINLGSTELCKIGTYQDYIYKSGDDWYVHKESGKTVFNGTENWVIQTYSQGGINYKAQSIRKSDISSNIDVGFKTTNMLSDYFTAIETHAIVYGKMASGSSYIGFGFSDNTSTTPFKTWLASNPVTFYYPLATPTDTKITDSTLISQLNAIHNWLIRHDYSGTVSGNLPIIINRTELT